MAIMLVAFFNVLGEKLRKIGVPVTGIPSSTEIVEYLHVPMVFLAAAFTTLDRGHTRIDLVCGHFPAVVQKILIALGNLMGAGICGFISYRSYLQTAKFLLRNKMSSTSGFAFPLWPFVLIMAIGFTLLAFSFLWAIARDFFGTGEPHKPDPMGGERQ